MIQQQAPAAAAGVDYLGGIALPLALDSVAIALVFPQVTGAASPGASGKPDRGWRSGGPGAVRQFGGAFGVVLTIALLALPLRTRTAG